MPDLARSFGRIRPQTQYIVSSLPLLSTMLLLSAANGFAAFFLVTSTNDSGLGSLRQAILNSASGDIINFAVTNVITLTNGQLRITNSLAIYGPGPTNLVLNGFGTRIFEIESNATVRISDLTIRNGFADDLNYSAGGAIYNEGDLTVFNCLFAMNRTTGRPGASHQPGSSEAAQPGKDGYGGAIFNIGRLVVSNSLFLGNLARGGQGGGGNGSQPGGNASGGAIYNSGFLFLLCNTFCTNDASGGDGGSISPFYTGSQGASGGRGTGGGIFNNGSAYVVCNTFCGNLVSGGNGTAGIQGGGPYMGGQGGGGGYALGGGLYNVDGVMFLTNNTVVSNRVVGGNGGNGGNRGIDSPWLGGNGGPGGDAQGGGLYNSGRTFISKANTLTRNATVAGLGSLGGSGGGIVGPPGNTLGGGLFDGSSTSWLHNTIVAANSPLDIFGIIGTDGHNLIGIPNDGSGWLASDLKGSDGAPLDPKLGPLQANGGSTWTMALLPGSPAIDNGDDTFYSTFGIITDQRGLPRRSGAHLDIGAFELQFATTPFYLSSQVSLENGVVQLKATNIPGASLTILGATNLSEPLSNWTILGTMSEMLPGEFKFTDTQANGPQRIYRLRSP
jgi:hypothetical protein